MKNVDNRVRYTKKVLQEALLKILHKKSIGEVTIKEICEEAHINRGTFYLHYSTPNDLLREIEQEFLDKNTEVFMTYFNPNHPQNNLAALFAGMFENKDLVKIIMGNNGNPRFRQSLLNNYRKNIIIGWSKEFPNYNVNDLNYVYDFIFAGSMELITSWIDDNKGLSSAELANRLDRLGHYCHLAISEFNKK